MTTDPRNPSPRPLRQAPGWEIERWLNVDSPLSLEALRGKVVVVYAFQMFCPGCVSIALPQAQRVAETFAGLGVQVVGLHTVFEHHRANSIEALQAFLHEYRIRFPIGVDMPSDDGPLPRTMTAYAMQGTPTLILIDRSGRLRKQSFGHESDLRLGAEIMALICEDQAPLQGQGTEAELAGSDAAGAPRCPVPPNGR